MDAIKKQAKQGEALLDQYVNNLNPEQQQPFRDKLFIPKAIRLWTFSNLISKAFSQSWYKIGQY